MKAAWPLGVDMLEWKKAKAFYKTHHKNLKGFLSSAEITYVKAAYKPYQALAMILSAKEAVFKALGISWMGVSGFQCIEILPAQKRFFLRLKGTFHKQFSKKTPLEMTGLAASPTRRNQDDCGLEIFFTKSRSYVIAHCCLAPCAGI